jgi:hypothetical protein
MVLTVSFVLSPEYRLVSLRRLPIIIPASLTPASGGQDHTTSPSARRMPRRAAACVHRIPSRASDDAYAPPGGRDGRIVCICSGFRKEKFSRETAGCAQAIEVVRKLRSYVQLNSMAFGTEGGAARTRIRANLTRNCFARRARGWRRPTSHQTDRYMPLP